MADPRFFDNAGALTLAQVEKLSGSKIVSAPHSREVFDVASLDRASCNHLTYCDSAKFRTGLERTSAGAVLVAPGQVKYAPAHVVVFECAQPSLAFAKISTALYPDAGLIWPKALPPVHIVASTAKIGAGTIVTPGVFIGENVEIGDDCIIGPGVVIGRGVQIGNAARIGSNASISHALIGDRCIIHPGSRIGQDGFGFAGTSSGHFKIPQLGRVIIQDDVEIGANSTIDRGALADTVIGEGTKIDNLVQIGHNTRVGRRCIIVSFVGISGSCEVGDHVVIGGQVGVGDHLKIGPGAFIAARSGVSRSLEGGRVYGGFPARPIEQWRREVGVVSRLAKERHTKNERAGDDDQADA